MHAHDSIHYLDGIILAVLIVGALVGACIGIVRPVVWFLTSSLSGYLSMYVNGPASELLSQNVSNLESGAVPTTAFVGTFLGVYLVLFLIRRIISMMIREMRGKTQDVVDAVGLRPLDRLVGAAIGFGLAALLSGTVVLALAMNPDVETDLKVKGSKLRPYVAGAALKIIEAIPEKSRGAILKAIKDLEDTGNRELGRNGGGMNKFADGPQHAPEPSDEFQEPPPQGRRPDPRDSGDRN